MASKQLVSLSIFLKILQMCEVYSGWARAGGRLMMGGGTTVVIPLGSSSPSIQIIGEDDSPHRVEKSVQGRSSSIGTMASILSLACRVWRPLFCH